jgi:hypothetical protein
MINTPKQLKAALITFCKKTNVRLEHIRLYGEPAQLMYGGIPSITTQPARVSIDPSYFTGMQMMLEHGEIVGIKDINPFPTQVVEGLNVQTVEHLVDMLQSWGGLDVRKPSAKQQHYRDVAALLKPLVGLTSDEIVAKRDKQQGAL